MNLLIVESPAKAKTINKYLGSGFEVLASFGHVRDLVPKEGAVDPEHDFRMKYQVIDKSDRHVQAIVRSVKKADALYLATDPDREGEAISWHLAELLREKDLIKDKPVYRVVFHEITKRAIQEAMAHPRELSMDLVNAQQARRALDYLVGFNLSPLLWRKVKRGLSAGRVQSPALRMIVEREDEILNFKPREYWTLEADLNKSAQDFVARLYRFHGERVEQFSFGDGGSAQAAEAELKAATKGGELTVATVEKKQRKRYPAPPFTTSTLQQEAVRKLGFSASRAMRVAQQLYEGVDIGGGAVGLITYMRTDSVSLAQEAVAEIRQFVRERYGAKDLPDEPRTYQTKAKNAQEAHEAIRPTSVMRTPEELRGHLAADQLKLYDLIWKRAVACQMQHATIDQVAVDFAAGEGNLLRATGSTIADPGFMRVYREDFDDAKPEDSDERMLPAMEEGDRVLLKALRSEQHFTEPPPRYTEASLVRALEEYGIGRPSTYASIISTLQNREYVEMDRRRFRPTDVGTVVGKFLAEHFTTYVDYDFTARLEDELDAVSRGEEEWVPLLKRFWAPFIKQVEDKGDVSRDEVAGARELGTDPKSGKPVSVRMGRYGPFVQIGTRDDEDKPTFASLRAGQRMDSISLDEALELFKLPRDLGETDAGEALSVNIGRFGPYVRYGSKFASLGKEDDPYTITRERALQLVAEKQLADANRLIADFPELGIQVLRGRYGPYITNGKKNAKIPKDREPESLTAEECAKLIEEAPEKGAARRGGARKAATSEAAAPEATKAPAKKAPAKKSAAKKPAAKKPAAKKPAAKKAAAKKPTTKG
ncbi:MAG: DNA topoisomerase I [Chromatiales bacterium]|nr:DNA topoisomerase I [Gammaproteobacteria bacterium]MCP5352181.1 DNA topoisomerase I [Chromatiales bacterium]